MLGEKVMMEQHKDTACRFDQILEAAPRQNRSYTATGLLSMKTIEVRQTRHAEYSWRNREELLWTPTYGHTGVGRLTKTYIYKLCADTRCRLEDLPKVMNDTDDEREPRESVQSALFDNIYVEREREREREREVLEV